MGQTDAIDLLVNQLGEIAEVPEEQIEKLSAIMGGETQLADSMVKKREGDSGNQMLVLLSISRHNTTSAQPRHNLSLSSSSAKQRERFLSEKRCRYSRWHSDFY